MKKFLVDVNLPKFFSFFNDSIFMHVTDINPKMSDSEILDLTKLQISDDEQEKLSELLFKNREIGLNKEETQQLDILIEISERNMLKKSEALRIAVERGLIKPLS